MAFREYMESFGSFDYAVLCKTKGDLMQSANEEDGAKQQSNHTGTGFVRFTSQADADVLLTLSQNLEAALTEDYKRKDKIMKKNKNAEQELLGASSLLKGELELNGRRLVIMPSVIRSRVSEVVKANKDLQKGSGIDRRNLYLKKEGLLNEASWVH